jgi:hypothetical protein
MKTVFLVCLTALSVPSAYASSEGIALNSDPADKLTAISSSSALPDAPDAPLMEAAASSKIRNSLRTTLRLNTRPFSSFAVAFTTGLGGLGVDVATPLATKINLRASASFLNYSPTVTASGIPVDAAIELRSVGAGVELFPYHNSFHITPGVTLFNGSHVAAVANITGGSTFTIDDTDYVSSPADPVHGTFDLSMGRKVAPSLTVGFGNMLRRDSHWSVPVEVGFQYIGQPKLTLAMTGSVCDSGGNGCDTIANDPDAMQNLASEQTKINNEISPLRFYPILKVGLSYRFGRNVKREYWY